MGLMWLGPCFSLFGRWGRLRRPAWSCRRLPAKWPWQSVISENASYLAGLGQDWPSGQGPSSPWPRAGMARGGRLDVPRTPVSQRGDGPSSQSASWRPGRPGRGPPRQSGWRGGKGVPHKESQLPPGLPGRGPLGERGFQFRGGIWAGESRSEGALRKGPEAGSQVFPRSGPVPVWTTRRIAVNRWEAVVVNPSRRP
jgi:hypothetical protein